MRTTVNIDDQLLVLAKQRAVAGGRSLSDIVNDALRILVAERAAERGAVRLPVFGGSGLQPGVDLEDKEALAALLDEAETRAAG